ncbi:MAG TPA: PQQ-binding-like beta-propeller repeat protein, partial [Myxococcaceae bacterium]|nr:PQQ-binding-like beta-propeller repeat protein [Myxococcaceae bacterium]
MTSPNPRRNTPKLTVLDPGSPDGGLDAFRRDDLVAVTVSSRDTDVDAGSVKLRVFGIASGSVTPVEVPLAPCASGGPGASDPFCRQGALPLASLPFEAFRGVVVLEASGSDLSNNLGSADGGVNVTRWKWRYSAGAPIYTTPAIADDGTVVFGTSDGGSGSLYALTPDGTEKWPPVVLGPIEASPAVGSGPPDLSLVYVATAATAGSKMYAVVLGDGSDA